jgi:hypothetical protein
MVVHVFSGVAAGRLGALNRPSRSSATAQTCFVRFFVRLIGVIGPKKRGKVTVRSPRPCEPSIQAIDPITLAPYIDVGYLADVTKDGAELRGGPRFLA